LIQWLRASLWCMVVIDINIIIDDSVGHTQTQTVISRNILVTVGDVAYNSG